MTSIVYCEDEAQYGEVIRQLHEMVRKKFHGEVKFDVVPSWEALTGRVETDPPSVILLDLALSANMGAEDTLFALDRVAAKWPPVMVLTGNASDLDLRRKCILAGSDDFMLKMEANRNPELLCERLYHCFLRRLRDGTRA